MTLPTIASLWIGTRITWYEAVCIQSYLDHGHRFVLFCKPGTQNIPDGVEVRSIDDEGLANHWPLQTRKQRACYSDHFRLLMIRDYGFVWSDLDAFCVRPLDLPGDRIYGAQNRRWSIATGILKLPPDSEALARCIAFNEEDNPIPPWFDAEERAPLEALKAVGTPHRIDQLDWAVSGPLILTHFLQETGEIKHALPLRFLYPFDTRRLRKFGFETDDYRPKLNKQTYSIHLFGENRRLLMEKFDGLPPKDSFFDQICRQHNIRPGTMPILPDETPLAIDAGAAKA